MNGLACKLKSKERQSKDFRWIATDRRHSFILLASVGLAALPNQAHGPHSVGASTIESKEPMPMGFDFALEVRTTFYREEHEYTNETRQESK